ncbi:class F sortase [Streptomyces justiciae]|uniref:Class F sortase n=1 Tax=Streptomyces justiciae TaxID=2780140 RepID=A0ABU3M3D6_9ACTN|nr:class F sortase [Streptomyces justiciae]MDT7846005.1 class F sortase [Streptomyces justiciae]
MTDARLPTPSRRGRRTRHAVALAGAATVVVTLATGCASPAKDPTHAAPSTPKPVASALPASVPTHITIPALGTDADLGTVGLDADGVMRTPAYDKPMRADWYKEGPTPGERGAAAIVGHKDTPRTSKAVFHNLAELGKGQRVDVRRADGTTAVFTVDAVDTFAKDAFPTRKVYGSTGGKAELRLITCGGRLTPDRHWDSNVVVFAHLTGTT